MTTPEQRRRRVVGIGVVTLLLIGVALLILRDGDEPAGDGPAGRRTVEDVRSGVSPDTFRYPTAVRGEVGDDVGFVNEDETTHTFTSDDGLFDSGPVQPGGTFEVATLAPGDYGYHCSIHPDLTGTLTIEG